MHIDSSILGKGLAVSPDQRRQSLAAAHAAIEGAPAGLKLAA